MTMLRPLLRGLRRSPGFALATVLILGLGIGATTAMFSLVNVTLLRPLPYAHSDRLVRIYRTQGAQRAWPHSLRTFGELREASHLFEAVAAFQPRGYSMLREGAAAEALAGLDVSAEFFDLLGVAPLRGRLFQSGEDEPGRNGVVVLDAELWQSRFGGDPAVLGRRLLIDGEPLTVVGIVAAEPERQRLWGKVQLYRPFGFTTQMKAATRRNWLELVGRLAPGVSLEAAAAAGSAIVARHDQGHPSPPGMRLQPLHRSGMDDTSARMAWMSMGLALLMLLIVCLNLAGLALSRHAGRSREYAVRSALGASRRQLAGQIVAESAVLALAGGGLGLLVARWCADLVGPRIVIGGAGRGMEIPLDGRVLAFAVGVVALATLVVGTIPALLSGSAHRAELATSLRQGDARSTGGGRPTLRRALVAAEVAVALALLSASVLFVRGLDRLVERDPGWNLDGLVTARVDLPVARYPSASERRQFVAALDAGLGSVPGIERASLSWWLPLASAGPTSYLRVEGRPDLERPGHEVRHALNPVSPGFFTTLGLRLLEGRPFTDADSDHSAPVAIVNETLARQIWPGRSALGQRLGRMGSSSFSTVVGVVADVRYPAKLSALVTRLQVYRPLAQDPQGSLVLAVRSGLPAETLTGPLRRALAAVDPFIPLQEPSTAREALDLALANVTLLARILLGFALLGMGLAALGIYSLFSGFVVSRTREIGVRVALGATEGRVQRMVLTQALRVALLGTALGLPPALAVGPLLASLAPELPASDWPAVLLLAVGLLALAALACWLPARRAAAVDPVIALRQE